MNTRTDAAIAARIALLQRRGLSFQEAVDATLGAGAFDRFVKNIGNRKVAS